MSVKRKSTKAGVELQNDVSEIAKDLNLNVRKEVKAGRRIWGSERRIDLVITHPGTGKTLGIECKFQKVPGTAEEKILATIKDMEYWPIPGIVVIKGEGFSEKMKGYLISTGKVVFFEDLIDWLKLYFGILNDEQRS